MAPSSPVRREVRHNDPEVHLTQGGCFTCEQNARTDRPPREEVHETDHWRVAHAFGSALPGWLVVVPTRHVVALDELTEDEMAPLGPLLANLTWALRAVTGCEKTYVALFAEAEGFAHVHFHVVPRMPWLSEEQRGPNVFVFLDREPHERVSDAEQDRLALAISNELARR